MSINSQWVLCPICGNKSRDRIREDTVLKNFPLYCPKCKRESLIEAKDLHITVIKEPHKDSYEAMKAFTEKRATMAIGYVRDCSAAEIKYLRHELCKGTAGA